MPKGKILVMDDEDLVRTVVGKMLEFLGYETVLARNGEEAVDFYRSQSEAGHPFNAVLLDLQVPVGINGFQTMERIRTINPDAKGILSSGYSEQDENAAKSAGFVAVIGKPYELKTLRATVEGVLGKTEPLA